MYVCLDVRGVECYGGGRVGNILVIFLMFLYLIFVLDRRVVVGYRVKVLKL